MSASLPSSLHGLPAQLPTRIGPYQVRGVIGTGSMGVVYLGHDPAIERTVAIKTIRRDLLEGDSQHYSAAARFRVEAQAAGRLNHRNIVSVYQFGQDDSVAFIAMEYVAGHSLADYLRRPERLSRDEVLCLMYQLLDALHFAHEGGVVHRDVKPANLLIDRQGRLKITDFGIARTEATTQLTRINMMVGSPGYMAPEQYTGGPIDRRVDIFSAGVVLYQMLAGVLPFVGGGEAIMYQIVYRPHDPLTLRTKDPTLAPWDAILDGALAKEPAQRFRSALEFREALAMLAQRPVDEVLPASRLMPLPESDESTRIAPSRVAAPGPAPSPSPPSVPVPTGWDELELADLERDLTRHVGPVAKVLVRRAARGQTSLAAVRRLLAAEILDPRAQERFLYGGPASGRPSAPAPLSASSGFGVSRPTLAPRSTPLSAADVDKIALALTRLLGPVGKVVARRCAEGLSTREQLVARVLEQVTARVDARTLEADLWRSLG
jgi:serine/threonine-protein kinase